MTPIILVIAGASGVGKTTVAEALCERHPEFKMSRSHTTRAPRGDGKDGEYIYCTESDFRALLASGELVEHTEYAGTLYGTSRHELSSITERGECAVLVLDYEGVKSMKNVDLGIPVVTVYIYSRLDIIEQRLYRRMELSGVTESANETLRRRMRVNTEDYLDIKSRVPFLDFLIENITVDMTLTSLESTLLSLGSVRSMPDEIKEAIANEIYLDAKAKLEKSK